MDLSVEASLFYRYFIEAQRQLIINQNQWVPGWFTESEGDVLRFYASMLPPKSAALEIGTYCGRSARWLVLGTILNKCSVVLVDPWEHMEKCLEYELFRATANGVNWPIASLALQVFPKDIVEDKVRMFALTSAQARKRKEVLDYGPFGLVHIDGDHEKANDDAELWAHKDVLEPWGILAFHDTLPRQTKAGRLIDRYGGHGPYSTVVQLVKEGWYVLDRTDELTLISRDPQFWKDRYTVLSGGDGSSEGTHADTAGEDAHRALPGHGGRDPEQGRHDAEAHPAGCCGRSPGRQDLDCRCADAGAQAVSGRYRRSEPGVQRLDAEKGEGA